jgi:hypothetical protein
MNEDRMTKEEFLASRKVAGRLIDVETCDIGEWFVDLAGLMESIARLPPNALGGLPS